jgi:hypothetical protein
MAKIIQKYGGVARKSSSTEPEVIKEPDGGYGHEKFAILIDPILIKPVERLGYFLH